MITARMHPSRAAIRDPGRAAWRIALAVLVLLRAGLWLAYAQTPLPTGPISDSWVYVQMAHTWITSGAMPLEVVLHSPLYPHLVGLSMAISGGSWVPLLLFQNASGVLSGLILLAWVRRLSASPLCFWAALLLLVQSGVWLSFEWRLFPVTLCIAAQLLFIECLVRLGEPTGRGSPRVRAHLLGALLGLLAAFLVLMRPNYLVALVLLAVYGIWRIARRELPAIALIYAVAIPVLCATPILIRNHALGAGYSLGTYAGVTFYNGNNPLARGGYTMVPGLSPDISKLNIDARIGASTGELASLTETDRYWMRQGLSYLAGNPGDAAVLMLRKLGLFVSPSEVGGDIGFPFERSQLPSLAFVSAVNFALLLFLALIALPTSAARASPLLIPSAAFFAAAMATCLLFYVQTRYRLTAWPLLIPFASVGVQTLYRGLRGASPGASRRTRGLWAAATLLCVALIAIGIRQAPTRTDRLSGWLNWGGSLERSGAPDAEVLRAFERVLEIDPRSRFGLENLGRFHLERGDLEAARRRLFALVASHPDSSVGHNNLSVLYMREGNWEAARRAAQRSVQLRPTDVSGYANLAKANLELGRVDEACAAYASVAPFLAGDPRAQPLRDACGSPEMP
jgi:hypothetical protein